MRVINFDGLGRPDVESVRTGDVLLLVQDGQASVVLLEIVPPEQFGPVLWHATNEAELQALAAEAVQCSGPPGLSTDRHWLLECPPEIARVARFADDAPRNSKV